MSEKKSRATFKRKRVRRHVRKITAAEKKRWDNAADLLLQQCAEIFEQSSHFDTAVRDTVAEGLAYLVHSAFDCREIALDMRDYESINSFIDNSTAEWFRERGFAEWFCCAAASLFRTSRPRTLAERKIALVNIVHRLHTGRRHKV